MKTHSTKEYVYASYRPSSLLRRTAARRSIEFYRDAAAAHVEVTLAHAIQTKTLSPINKPPSRPAPETR